jgi:YggT family protein
MIHIVFAVLNALLGLLIVVLVVQVVISWLIAFDIVSRRNQVVGPIWEFTNRLTDPILRPLRKLIPPIAGVDLSILVLLLVISLMQNEILPWLESVLRGGPVL